MKRQRNIVNSMIDSAKRDYISKLLDRNAACPKKFWKQINQLLKGDNGVYQLPRFVDPTNNEEILLGNESVFLNEYFCNISRRMGFDRTDTVTYVDNDYLDIYLEIDDIFNLAQDPVTVGELMIYSDDIDLTKNCCVEGLTTEICRDLLRLVPECFVSIFASSLDSSIFPIVWAKGIITVIPKSGNLSDPSNWRPITQTCIFAKIFEKIVYSRVLSYFTENNLLSPYQYGFRKGKSTQQAIFDLTKFIYSGLNHKKIIGTVCLDVAKAFDSINHDILMYKMKKIGFSDNSIAWFRSYLHRTQSVKFGNNTSPDIPVVTGIGQGTILGPLLFIFYINDIVSVPKYLKINMHADDCILYTSGNDWNIMVQRIQPELDSMQTWYAKNRLKINVKKSKVLLIGSRQKEVKIDVSEKLYFENSSLLFSNKYNYLGVILDSEMSLSHLVATTKKNVTNKLFNLRKLRRYINEKGALAIYKQTILPLFDNVGFMLISCKKSDRSDLQVIQNDALRTCYNVRLRDRLSIAKMHKKSNLLSLEQRRTFQLLGLMYLHKKNR